MKRISTCVGETQGCFYFAQNSENGLWQSGQWMTATVRLFLHGRETVLQQVHGMWKERNRNERKSF